jgi:hypothetical protein
MDLAFVYKTQKDELYYFPSAWDKEGNPIVSSKSASFKNTLYKGLVTLGYKF